jgi:hypothetical protein
MHDDRHLRYLGVSAARGRRPALRAFADISQRMMIAATGKRGRANADRDARLVHHLKHDGETLPHLADAKTNGARFSVRAMPRAFAKGEQTIGRAAIPHLVIEAHHGDVVALAKLTGRHLDF